MATTSSPTRWGLFCSGKITQDFALAVSSLPPSEHQLVGIATRELTTAQNFAKTFNVQKAYGSYEELVRDPEIDIVYVGAIGPFHFTLSKLAMENGKHVLCEKPLCVNSNQVKELVSISKKQGRFLMEGLWSRAFPAYKKFKEELSTGTIGDLKQVLVTFSLNLKDQSRLGFNEKARGSLMDVGVYCVQFVTLAFGQEKPLKIISGGHLNEGKVDESTSTTLIFSGGRTATIVTHYGVTLPSEALAIGTKGILKMPFPFWCPTILETPNGTLHFELPKAKREGTFTNSVGLSYQCQEIRSCIANGLIESPLMTHKDSILISEIMDSIRKQVGVVYPQD